MSEVKIPLFPPSGTRDFYPNDMLYRNWLFGIWHKIAKSFGFSEYDAPVVEHSELYTRKDGDDILNEMFSFEKDGIKLSLRAEMTPSLSRMMINTLPTEILPVKWYSIPQCWRYEKVTSLRKREHYQWNIDIFGGEKVKSEIEIFSMIIMLFKEVGLKKEDVVIKVSNRLILEKVFLKMNVKEDKIVRAFNLVDKILKLDKKEFTKMMKDELSMSEDNVDMIYKLTELKNIKGLDQFIDKDDEVVKEMTMLFNVAKEIGIDEWLQFDVSVVRGLSYYTGVVFEGFCKNENIKRAICGGGRYDNLLKSYGYKEKVGACGAGFGDVVILEILNELKLLPVLKTSIDYVIIPFNDEYFGEAHKIAKLLRDKGKIVDVYGKSGKIKIAYSYADRKNAKYVIFVAPDEWKKGEIVLKNLKESSEIKIKLDDYINQL